MNMQIEMGILEKRKNRNKCNIYCLFGTIQSFDSFHLQRKRKMSLEQLRKINQNQNSHRDKSHKMMKDLYKQKQKEQEQKTEPLAKNSDGPIMKCQKCKKLLLQQQYQVGLCCQCVRMEKAIKNGNFSKFIHYVMGFKKNKLPSYEQTYKIKRIGSIQSCQSLILNKAESSSRLSVIKSKIKNKQTHHVKSSNTQSKNFRFHKITPDSANKQSKSASVTSSGKWFGYFCDGCNVSPIEGQRFHCLSCSDYDLCQKCYFYIGHRHQMTVKRDSREQRIRKAKENVLQQSQKIKKALPFLSQSIQQFQSMQIQVNYKFKKQILK